MDLSNFREEYLKGQLHRKDLAENPFEQFQTWFDQALKAGIPEPNAFSLATANAQAVLAAEDDGFYEHPGIEITGEDCVAKSFPDFWERFGRMAG